MRLSESVKAARDALRTSGVEDASFEAAQLHQKLGFSKEDLLLRDPILSPAQDAILQQDLKKRCSGYPLQYLLGEWEFYSLPFRVGEGVLIPRQDTECLVDCALQQIRFLTNPQVADLCSGSGCIAIAIAKNRPDCRMWAMELSEAAYPYLCENIRLNEAENVTACHRDILEGPSANEEFDLIVSNPPYLTRQELSELQPEVRFEPKLALDGGEDGLLFYRAIISLWYSALKPGGWIILECGFEQGKSLHLLLSQHGYEQPKIIKDHAGNDRVVFAQKGKV